MKRASSQLDSGSRAIVFFGATEFFLRQNAFLRQSPALRLCLKKPIISRFMRQERFLPQKSNQCPTREPIESRRTGYDKAPYKELR